MLFAFTALLFFQSAHAEEIVVPKKLFLDELKVRMADTFCAEKMYFRKCFDVTEEKCKKSMSIATTACIAASEAKIPAQIHQPADGQTWGKTIGGCSGEKYEMELLKSKNASADCKDPSKWQ